MAVKIRLARTGRANAPFFRLVAIDSRSKRDGKFIENLGTYNPLTGQLLQFHKERVDYWISKGAIETNAARKLYRQFKKEQKSSPAPQQ
jgi:small subunit ribosomal protein S16